MTSTEHELTLEEAGLAYLTGITFTDEAFFHAASAKLRAEDPVHWVEHEDVNPFYLLTKHADILEVELHQNEFLNAPRAILGNKEADAMREKASREIELERRKTMDELKGEISGLAVEIASKVAEKEIGEQEHEALIEKFIDELGEGS